MRCPNCGTENVDSSRFCQACGTASTPGEAPHHPASDRLAETQTWSPSTSHAVLEDLNSIGVNQDLIEPRQRLQAGQRGRIV